MPVWAFTNNCVVRDFPSECPIDSLRRAPEHFCNACDVRVWGRGAKHTRFRAAIRVAGDRAARAQAQSQHGVRNIWRHLADFSTAPRVRWIRSRHHMAACASSYVLGFTQLSSHLNSFLWVFAFYTTSPANAKCISHSSKGSPAYRCSAKNCIRSIQ